MLEFADWLGRLLTNRTQVCFTPKAPEMLRCPEMTRHQRVFRYPREVGQRTPIGVVRRRCPTKRRPTISASADATLVARPHVGVHAADEQRRWPWSGSPFRTRKPLLLAASKKLSA